MRVTSIIVMFIETRPTIGARSPRTSTLATGSGPRLERPRSRPRGSRRDHPIRFGWLA
jgi:hypothetical protein